MNFLDARLPDRFWSKCIPEPNSGCWLWTASSVTEGYGRFGSDRKKQLAHRVSYEAFVGSVPAGLELDHLCSTPCCVNPGHLEPVTHRLNVIRSRLPEVTRSRHASRTHCNQGHEYTPGNTRITSNGRRRCRTCDRHREAGRVRDRRSA